MTTDLRVCHWRTWFRRLLGPGIAIIVGVVLAYRIWFTPVAAEQHIVEEGEVVAEVMGSGTLEARYATNIGSKLAGRIASISVDQGDRVEAGQTLAQLESDELIQQVAVAEAEIAKAEAAIEQTSALRLRAEAELNQARLEHDRLAALIASKAATPLEFDRAREVLAAAQAEQARAESAMTEARQQLNVARQTLAYHQARLQESRIVAPFTGLIVRRHRNPGDVVVPGSTILELISTEQLWISAWVDETQLDALAPGQPARVVFRSQPDISLPAQVARLGLLTDRETREILVDVTLNELPDRWAIGQRAEVYIQTDRQLGVVLPREMIAWRGGEPGVWRNVGGRMQWCSLELGLQGRDCVAVARGLSAGADVLHEIEPTIGDSLDGRRVHLP